MGRADDLRHPLGLGLIELAGGEDVFAERARSPLALEPANPGIVFSSNGKTVLLSMSEFSTTAPFSTFHAHLFACPNGGSPVSVGRISQPG